MLQMLGFCANYHGHKIQGQVKNAETNPSF